MIDEPLREAIQELEDYLDGVPEDRAAELVLPFATRWVLADAGYDLARLREEATTFVQATPFSDRILTSYREHLAYWISQRMLLDRRDGLETAERLLQDRARETAQAGFPRVGQAIGDAPGGEPLLTELARRIGESVLA